ncbi:MAG TPA: PqqD family protein, partial [Saprospiraceae bacterium]|nr:PqqD family protein [Saprospiraceae bacterium]
MQINKNIAISDSGFIFNPSSGDSFSANAVGLEIIRLFKDGKSKEDVINTITQNYAVDASTFE